MKTFVIISYLTELITYNIQQIYFQALPPLPAPFIYFQVNFGIKYSS